MARDSGGDGGAGIPLTIENIEYSSYFPWPTVTEGFSLHRRVPGAYGNDPANWKVALPDPGQVSPGSGDADGDDLPNDWEVVNGTNPLVDDANRDDDGDSQTNHHEYLAGTNPRQASSRFELAVVSWNPAAREMTLNWTTIPERLYTVEMAPSLEGPYTPIRSGIVHPVGQVTIRLPDEPRNFYRVTVRLP